MIPPLRRTVNLAEAPMVWSNREPHPAQTTLRGVSTVTRTVCPDAPRFWAVSAEAELARFMGTSVEQIDKTYGHLMPNAIEPTTARLDEFARLFPERSPDHRGG